MDGITIPLAEFLRHQKQINSPRTPEKHSVHVYEIYISDPHVPCNMQVSLLVRYPSTPLPRDRHPPHLGEEGRLRRLLLLTRHEWLPAIQS